MLSPNFAICSTLPTTTDPILDVLLIPIRVLPIVCSPPNVCSTAKDLKQLVNEECETATKKAKSFDALNAAVDLVKTERDQEKGKVDLLGALNVKLDRQNFAVRSENIRLVAENERLHSRWGWYVWVGIGIVAGGAATTAGIVLIR